ncbi:hypothetical protein Cni_G15301 [Canna indica]|uniref:Fucosyltransferase n=1 Tax=Canna indica TaxID=4628 RepID=A0AAQ3KDL1_9LILI|nr:hypothetical protein Cni_G15301 [Canna indica]
MCSLGRLHISAIVVASCWRRLQEAILGVASVCSLYVRNRPSERSTAACRRAESMEPCFHTPPKYDCKAHKDVDKGAVVRHVRHCEDLDEGLKLFD